MTQTFNILGKDIQLAPSTDGYYDRVLQNGDWVMLNGIECLQNDIDLCLNVRYGEMVNNPTYGNWGNPAWNDIKLNNNGLMRTAIQEAFSNAILGISRVKSLDYINIVFDPTPPGGVDVTYSVTGMDDQSVTGTVSL